MAVSACSRVVSVRVNSTWPVIGVLACRPWPPGSPRSVREPTASSASHTRGAKILGGRKRGLLNGGQCCLLVERVGIVNVMADCAGHRLRAVFRIVEIVDGLCVLIEVGSEDACRRSGQEILVDKRFRRITAAAVGQAGRRHLLVGRGQSRRQDAAGSASAIAASKRARPSRVSATPPASISPKRTPSVPSVTVPSASRIQPRLGQRLKRLLPQQHSRTARTWRSLDDVDHLDTTSAGRVRVDIEDAGSEVVDVRGGHPGDVGGHRGHLGELLIPATIDWLPGQRECGPRGVDEGLPKHDHPIDVLRRTTIHTVIIRAWSPWAGYFPAARAAR